MKRAIVTGAGGFIGSHLTTYLKEHGYHVVGIDIHKPAYSPSTADTFVIGDLRDETIARTHIHNADELYMLAADMGGVAYIENTHAKLMHDNALINAHSLEAARRNNVHNVFFASSACAYPQGKQIKRGKQGLKESDAIPADPDTMYGWEKLFSEQLVMAYHLDHGLNTHIARFHNVYGPEGTYDGGREKSPAAICRKVAQAQTNDTIEVWGDGNQTRSYCYITDCVEGVYALMHTDYHKPLNIGSDRAVSINELVDIVASIANKTIHKQHNTTQAQGVRHRNSNNTLLKHTLNWEPRVSLVEGLTQTYHWIAQQVASS